MNMDMLFIEYVHKLNILMDTIHIHIIIITVVGSSNFNELK